MESRQLYRLSQHLRLPASIRHFQPSSSQIRCASSKASERQTNPIGDYYTSILESSSSPTSPSPISSAPPTTASPSNPPITSTPDPEPSILFSSRLSSPLERRSEIQKKSKLVAGVLVPPKPEEPDNCCMSGCVNCVWDRYRDEIEEWAAARSEADIALQKEKKRPRGRPKKPKKTPGMEGTGMMLGEGEKGAQHTMISMDDDGGGSESNWGTGLDTEFTSEGLFSGVPVGIREFMKQEKRLKEKHAREGTKG